MRMDQGQSLTAYEVVNSYAQEQLADVLYQYGELRSARAMARAIEKQREQSPIRTTDDLKQVLKPFLVRYRENKVLAQVYQAIRIDVNQDIEVLKQFLLQVPQLLKEKGRLSLISYHSLEDRLVKRFIRDGNFEGQAEKDFYGNTNAPLKKVGGLQVPTADEIAQNNRARSAKLRVAERTA